jgi:hypothetical protein
LTSLPSPPCSIAGAKEQGIRLVSREKFRGGAGPRHRLDGSTVSGFKWSLPVVSIALSRFAVDLAFCHFGQFLFGGSENFAPISAELAGTRMVAAALAK